MGYCIKCFTHLSFLRIIFNPIPRDRQMSTQKTEERDIELKDLKPGDILIFDGETDDLISRLIMAFTNSRVTHGAIFMRNGEDAFLADAGENGIHTHLVKSFPTARGVHVRRITKKGGFENFDKTIEPVIDIARNYTQQGLAYPYSNLVLLAMILIYKDVSHVSLKQAAIIKFLKLAAAELKTLIDEKNNNGKHTMESSSFVYQCFLDASKNNPDLKIDIKNGDISGNPGKCKRTATLLDLFAEHAAEYGFNKSFAAEKDEQVTESVQEILENLVDKENEDHIYLLKSKPLSSAIEGFLKMLLKAGGIVVDNVKDLIDNAKKQQAMFVTPHDLYCHTTNTISVGKVPLFRNSEKYDP